MAVKTFKPTSPAVRGMAIADYSVLTKKDPEKSLLKSKKKSGGRNSYGRITVRHIGGGNRTKLQSRQSSTILTEQLTWHSSSMLMVLSPTSSLPRASR